MEVECDRFSSCSERPRTTKTFHSTERRAYRPTTDWLKGKDRRLTLSHLAPTSPSLRRLVDTRQPNTLTMTSRTLQCVLLGLLLGVAGAAGDNSNMGSMNALKASSANWADMFKQNSWLGDWQEKFSKPLQMASCDPSDSHCTVSKTGSTNSKSSSSSLFGGSDEDYHCQVSADGRSKSCSYSSSSSSPGSTHSRKLLQTNGLFSCQPGDAHCTTSTSGNTNSNAFSSSIFGGNDEDMHCQVSADGMSKSCSSSSSSGGGSTNARASGQSGFWSSVGTAATTWWVWVLFILAAAVALFTLARRRNVYVMLRGNSNPDSAGLPRFNKGRDNKEAQLY
ncbi:hypothetical protein WJX73_005705 [Symbiochloris irregularis]|uniref:Uncharacterized protein n=1 Tax=Symbiochloris irregularis TaxID=706552 RepID=A0AAW1PNR7_9CHLO